MMSDPRSNLQSECTIKSVVALAMKMSVAGNMIPNIYEMTEWMNYT